MRAVLVALAALLLAGTSACSLITVQQDPFPPLEIKADRPGPPPARVVLTASSIVIKDKIQFKLGSSEILPESFGLLDEIVAMLKDNPQIEVLQVEGHTDSSGGAAVNRKLSQDRAGSVRKYLVDKGIEGKRLVAKGFGPDRPIADNGTDEGREQNRRVEFNIVKQGPKKTVVQEE
jgi:outer membrane protein OmpA-like peptidoglycan-associated protein